MLRITGSNKTLCDGFSRRDLLQVGGLSALGLTLGDFLNLQSAQANESRDKYFGKAKACILFYLFGSPPQHETFDPKPEAPAEIQGEMKAIASKVPGLSICERLPKIAQVTDRITVVRSMTHPYPVHGVAYALTGMPTYSPAIELAPRAPEHWPYLGSIVDWVGDRASGGKHPDIPRHMGLPWQFGCRCDLPTIAGPYSAFLGEAYDPVWTDFDGKGLKVVPHLRDGQTKQVYDPFGSTEPTGRFRLADATGTVQLSPERVGLRRALLGQFDQSRQWLSNDRRVDTFDKWQKMAWSLLSTTKVRDALDVQREPDSVRNDYGMTLVGQSCLAARRLVEAGSKFVSVFWDPFEFFGGGCWDTHNNHYPRLKQYLLPVFDEAYSALIRDLDARGMLEDTLVLCVSEHGRTPKIDSKPQGAGRHHWSRVYSASFAGAGIARGRVVGRSDSQGGDVADTPMSPKDMLATSLYLMGIDPHLTAADRTGRPLILAGDGQVRRDLLG